MFGIEVQKTFSHLKVLQFSIIFNLLSVKVAVLKLYQYRSHRLFYKCKNHNQSLKYILMQKLHEKIVN